MDGLEAESLLDKVLGNRYHLTARVDGYGLLPRFVAYDTRLQRPVEVQIVATTKSVGPKIVSRIEAGAKLSATFPGQHVVRVQDFGRDGPWVFVVTDHSPVRTLRNVLENGALAPRHALSVCDAMLQGLAALHAAGHIHGSLSPESIFLYEDGAIRVDGFGLYSALNQPNSDETGEIMLGPAAYLAPELVLGKEVGPGADVFSAGVMLYEMLTGQPPFSGESPLQIAYQNLNSDMPRPSDAQPEVASDLDELVLWSTARDPGARLSDGEEFLRELRNARALLSSSAQSSRSDSMSWLPDTPAATDELQRRPLAKALSTRLRRICKSSPGEPFLFQIDGPWGAGKSTLLSFLREELEDEWLTIPLNAWRESRINLPWWSLLVAMRTASSRDLSVQKRTVLRLQEVGDRLRRVGAPLILAGVFFLVFSIAFISLLGQDNFNITSVADATKSVTALLAGAGTVWVGALVAGRFVLWDSARGAALFERSTRNPMQEVADHFRWLVARAARPVIFLVDDLDRCDHAYVVDFLEAVQTLIKDAPAHSAISDQVPPTNGRGVYFVIAADGVWIRSSYETVYEKFSSAVAEPGRPLGYLFLDKLFQLRVTVPNMDLTRGNSYLGHLLRTASSSELSDRRLNDEEQVVRTYIEQSATESDIMAVYRSASADVRGRVSEQVVEKLTSSEAEAETGYRLQRFAVLLRSNPRSTKRFLNTYSIQRAVSVLEGNYVPSDTLALWIILEMRWPSLADFLKGNPEAIDNENRQEQSGDDWENARLLLALPDVQEVTNFRWGGPLTPQLIRDCCGG